MKQYSIKIIFILFLTLDIVSAQTYANSSAGNDGTGNGSSAAPYKTFYKAYTVVASYGIIDLTGTFTWTDTDETADAQYTGYTISKHLTIRGQGPGSTIIQAHSSANSADRRVFTITDGYTVTFKNLSIKHGKGFAGYIGQTYFTYHGGAIGSAYGSSTGLTLNLENVNISTNYSSYTIAGVYCEGKITVNKCTFENNSAT
ncbi:MAG: hypothetical protein EXR16_05365, partial [Bacteroidetes bacterium]|nr:hypothetical protein [Bacteroidota bacterium]